jgi:hypothetical protein
MVTKMSEWLQESWYLANGATAKHHVTNATMTIAEQAAHKV